MIERTISNIVRLSKQHPKVEIDLTLRVELQKLGYANYEIYILPSLVPDDLLHPLWSRVRDGATAAIWEVEQVLLMSNIRVDIVDLHISEPFDAFNNKEIEKLGREL